MTDSNVFFLNAHEAMQRLGVDVEEIYRRLDIDPLKLLQPGTRIPHHAQYKFWQAVEEVTGDPEIGIHLCPLLSPFAGEVLNHLLVSSPTLGDGFNRTFRYLRLLSDHLTIYVSVDIPGPHALLACRLGDPGIGVPRHSEVTFLYGLLQAIRYAAGGLFSPSRITLCCADPEQDAAEFQRAFGCPVEFSAEETRCYFERTILDMPLLHADPDIAVAHEVVAQRRMRWVLKHDLVGQVRNLITSQLEDDQSCSLEHISQQLGRPPRSLRKELLDIGTNFKQIVTEARQSVAKQLLLNSSEPVEQIAHLTGFSERSAFFRAFKQWTGMTPMEYRSKRHS